jgi:hypothetical protein
MSLNIRRATSVARLSRSTLRTRFLTSGVTPPPVLSQTIKIKNPAPVRIGALVFAKGMFLTIFLMLTGSLDIFATSSRPDCLEPISTPFFANAAQLFAVEDICLARLFWAAISPGEASRRTGRKTC